VLDEPDITAFLDRILVDEEAVERALTVLAHDIMDTVVAQAVHDVSLGLTPLGIAMASAEKTEFDTVG
jgi:pyrimidine operon attenuation protein/uracil phosphoribosyltransferase